jgi:hypothetical protein
VSWLRVREIPWHGIHRIWGRGCGEYSGSMAYSPRPLMPSIARPASYLEPRHRPTACSLPSVSSKLHEHWEASLWPPAGLLPPQLNDLMVPANCWVSWPNPIRASWNPRQATAPLSGCMCGLAQRHLGLRVLEKMVWEGKLALTLGQGSAQMWVLGWPLCPVGQDLISSRHQQTKAFTILKVLWNNCLLRVTFVNHLLEPAWSWS